VSGVYLEDDPDVGRTAVVIVPDDQLSLAIGREGQNARLAAKLTGWRIDIKSVTEAVQEGLANIDSPALRMLKSQQPALVEDVQRIVEKRAANRAVMPEEYNVLAKFADLMQKRVMSARDAARQARLAEIEAVKLTLPPGAFQLPVTALELPGSYAEALQGFDNVGEIMLRFLIDESRVRRALNELPAGAFAQLQEALDKLVIPEYEAPPVEAEPDAEVALEAGAAVTEVPGVPLVETEAEIKEREAEIARRDKRPREEIFVEEEDADLLDKDAKGGKGKKNKGRQLVFDEKTGGMVVKRQRKGNRGRGDTWNNWDE
jgi:N utilization substance protein A